MKVKPHKSTLIYLLKRVRRSRGEQLWLSIAQSAGLLEVISLNVFESDQSWAAGKPGVRGVQLALKKGAGSHGVRSGGGRAEGQRGEGVERRIVGGRGDEAFKGFQRKEKSPPRFKMWNTLPSPHSLPHPFTRSQPPTPNPHSHTNTHTLHEWGGSFSTPSTPPHTMAHE